MKTKEITVLMLAPTPFFSDRGCHVRIFEETRVLKSLGYHIDIFTYHIGRDIEGINTYRIIRIPWYKKLTAGPSYHKLYIDLILLCYVVYYCLRKKPDIIHAHLHEGIVIGKIAGLIFQVPLIADIQGSLTDELIHHKFIKPNGMMHRLLLLAERLIVTLPDVILISSKGAFKRSPISLQKVMNKSKLIIDGVDVERFNPNVPSNNFRAHLNIPEGVKIVGYLGLLTEYQGMSVLIESISHVVRNRKNVHFLIMGYPNVDYYKKKVEKLGLEKFVTFTGRINYDDAPKYLSICDLAVSPKLSITESNGKLMNYMAMGLPIVASDTSVNREILGELGVYASIDDPEDFAQAILHLLSDGEYSRLLGTRILKKAETEYSWLSLGEKISDIYQSMLRQSQSKQEWETDVNESIQ